MPSTTEWEKLPANWTGLCRCGEKSAQFRNREKFSSGNIGEWLYFCEQHAIEYNGYRALPEEMRTVPPTFEQSSKELSDRIEREAYEGREPKTDTDKLLNELQHGEPKIPDYDEL
jgi:hypothetical protein